MGQQGESCRAPAKGLSSNAKTRNSHSRKIAAMRFMVLISRQRNESAVSFITWTTKATILSLVIFVAAQSSQLQAQEHKTISITKLGNILDCLKTEFPNTDEYAPPHADANLYRVRYVFGIYGPADMKDELQLLVYSKGEKSAVYYNLHLMKQGQRPVIYIGGLGTFIKEHGKLVLDENPGGIATGLQVQKLADFLGRKAAIAIPPQYVRAGSAACVFQH